MSAKSSWWRTPVLILLDRSTVDQNADVKTFRRNLAELIAVKGFSLIELPVHESIAEDLLQCVYLNTSSSSKDTNLLREGTLLARSKSNNNIYLNYPASDEDMVRSLDGFLILCQLLGAKKVTAKQLGNRSEYSESERSTKVSGRGKSGAEGRGSISRTEQTSFEEKFRYFEEHGATFDGCDPNIVAAKAYLLTSGLWRHTAFHNIVTMVENEAKISSRMRSLHSYIDLSWERSETSHLNDKIEGSLSLINSIGTTTELMISAEHIARLKRTSDASYRREINIDF